MTYIVMAYIVMADIVMAYIVITYIVMVYIVVALHFAQHEAGVDADNSPFTCRTRKPR